MENRMGFHGVWFLIGLVSSFAMGTAVPLLAVICCSVMFERTLEGLAKDQSRQRRQGR